MVERAVLHKEIDKLPPQYISEVINFVGYLQHKAQQAAAQKETAPARRELTSEEAAQFKVMPNPKMTAKEEAEYLRKNAEWLNREAMDALEDQVDIFANPRGELWSAAISFGSTEEQ